MIRIFRKVADEVFGAARKFLVPSFLFLLYIFGVGLLALGRRLFAIGPVRPAPGSASFWMPDPSGAPDLRDASEQS